MKKVLHIAMALIAAAAASNASSAPCKTDADCRKGQMCRAGRCESIVCTQDYRPVCGVDGKTYPNGCMAGLAHVAIRHSGKCAPGVPPARSCGGPEKLACPATELCDLPIGTCSSTDLLGVCAIRPGKCPEELLPVCGCDGKTYTSDCERLQAQSYVQKAHDGKCDPPPVP
jgi:hypothetical protein